MTRIDSSVCFKELEIHSPQLGMYVLRSSMGCLLSFAWVVRAGTPHHFPRDPHSVFSPIVTRVFETFLIPAKYNEYIFCAFTGCMF